MNKESSAKLAVDCILIKEMGVRKNTRSATGVHLLPPNRPRPGIQTTHCRLQIRMA